MKRIILLFFVLFILILYCACSQNREPEHGLVRVLVKDGFSDTPVAGACVTVPETGGRYYTDDGGLTEPISVPVIPDTEYEKLLPSGEGRATLLVTAEGRTPYLLLYARIRPNEERTIEILLFPADGTLPVFTVIEAPGEGWCASFAERFRPDK
jgi:hypothetical protein